MFNKSKPNAVDSKSKSIAVMYLSKNVRTLKDELDSGDRPGENETFTATHDIKCLENVIEFLSK